MNDTGGEAPRVINTAFPGGVGRWEVRRSQFRQGGRRAPNKPLLLLYALARLKHERQADGQANASLLHEPSPSLVLLP